MDQVFKKNMGRKPIVDSPGYVLDLRKLLDQQALALRRVQPTEDFISRFHLSERRAAVRFLRMCC
jgi:hypothetical protein